MHDSQKEGHSAKSGGRRVDDHSFWAGKQLQGQVLPGGGAHVKHYKSDGHAGHLSQYEDNNERIVKTQNDGEKHAEGRPLKPGYRY